MIENTAKCREVTAEAGFRLVAGRRNRHAVQIVKYIVEIYCRWWVWFMAG